VVDKHRKLYNCSEEYTNWIFEALTRHGICRSAACGI
jgi:hypothetical protein